MQPKQQKQIPATADIIDIDSSDDDGGPAVAPGFSPIKKTGNSKPLNGAKLHNEPPTTTQPATITNKGDAPAVNVGPVVDRSFWRAGAYDIGPTLSTLVQGLFPFYVLLNLFYQLQFITLVVIVIIFNSKIVTIKVLKL